VMAVGLLAACANDPVAQDPTPAPPSNAETPGTQDPPPPPSEGAYLNPGGIELHPVTIDFRLSSWDTEQDTARIAAAVNEYLASMGKPYSVEFKIHAYGEYWDNTINLMLSTGEPIDAIFIAGWAGDFRTQAATGTLRPLNDLIVHYPGIEGVLGREFMFASEMNGQLFGLPCNKEHAANRGWVVRRDIADALGMDISRMNSRNDLLPYVHRAMEEHNMYIFPGSWAMDGLFDGIVGLGSLSTIGTELRNPTQIVHRETLPEWIEGLRVYAQWNEDGLLNRDIMPTDSAEMEFSAGRTWANNQQLKPGKDGELTSALGIELVQFETGPPVITTGDTIGAMVAIPANARNPFETMDFINLLYTDKKMINLVIFGQAGIDYEYVDQERGIVELLESNWNMVGSAWTLGNQLLNYVTSDEDPDKWLHFQTFNDAAVPSPTLGFVPDLTDADVQTHIATLSAITERYWDLFMGLVPIAQFDSTVEQFKNELNAGGLEDLIAEIQRQFDEWRASR